MPMSDVIDLKHEQLRRTAATLSDDDLIYVMLGLLSDYGDERPTLGANGEFARRVVFSEIAKRWLPPDVFGAAFRRLSEA